MSWWATAHVGTATHAPNGEALTRDEKLMALILADHHDPAEDCSWPGVFRLAEMALMSKRHAITVLHSLERKEFLVIVRGSGRGHGSEYHLLTVPPQPSAIGQKKGAQRAPFTSEEKLRERVQKGCTEQPERVQKGCTARERYKEEPTDPIEPTKLSTAGAALKAWLWIKTELQKQLPEQEWRLWVRPAYLLKVLSGSTLLVALPPSGRIIEAAQIRAPDVLAVIARECGYVVKFTRYPDGYDRERLRAEYPEFYGQMLGNQTIEARVNQE
jgi:hypothetical protein